MIRDSGERTEFTTGAVRDMHDGKGRMDLLPWAASATKYFLVKIKIPLDK